MEENMDGFLFMVIFTFLLFAVILPIVGFVIGFFCYYVLPYAFAAVLASGIAVLVGVNIVFSWWIWVVGLIWAAAVHIIRMKFRELGEDVEHHHAAHAILLAGWPLQRRRSQLAES
jgi:heme/copper-type cytochrome/quinol oxidase subunit 2